MLLKAIVVEKIDNYSLKIRIPRYNKVDTAFMATPDEDLCIAPICTPPGVIPNYELGDVVIVGFENDLWNQPIILGQLYCNKNMESTSEFNASSLRVKDESILSEATNIGELKYSDIINTKNTRNNIQYQLDCLESKINE